MSGVDFALGYPCTVLLGDDQRKVLPTILSKSTVLSQIDDDTILLAWPDIRCGLLTCMVMPSDAGNPQIKGWWPFSSGHEFYEFEIDCIHLDVDAPEIRICEGAIGPIRFTVFDTLCRSRTDELGQGDLVRADLHGWALTISRSSNEPIMVRAEDANGILLKAFTADFEQGGQIVFDTDLMTAILPYGPQTSPLHEIRGIVKRAYAGPVFLDRPFVVFTLVVARLDDDEELTINVTAPLDMWDDELPEEGEAVKAVIWLQANFSPRLTP